MSVWEPGKPAGSEPEPWYPVHLPRDELKHLMMLATCPTNQTHLLASFYRTCGALDNKRLSDYVLLMLFDRRQIRYVLPLSFQREYIDHRPRH